LHREEISKPETPFRLTPGVEGDKEHRQLLVGIEQLRVLNEFDLVESPKEMLGYIERNSSTAPAAWMYSFPLKVMQRGKDKPETLTIALTADAVDDLATLIHVGVYEEDDWAPPYRPLVEDDGFLEESGGEDLDDHGDEVG